MKSCVESKVDDPQRALRLVRTEQRLDRRVVIAQPSMLAAIKLCISAAGFDAGKEVYSELEIDAGHWSRILRGDAHFPVNKLNPLMDLCGNEAPLHWLVNDRGYDIASLRFAGNRTGTKEPRAARGKRRAAPGTDRAGHTMNKTQKPKKVVLSRNLEDFKLKVELKNKLKRFAEMREYMKSCGKPQPTVVRLFRRDFLDIDNAVISQSDSKLTARDVLFCGLPIVPQEDAPKPFELMPA